MRETIFLSFAAGDAPRAGVIAAALRQAGITVAGDLALPAGLARADLFAEALAEAWLVVPVWSPRSIHDADLRAEAEAALARGGCLGLLIDGAAPPPALAAAPGIDLTGWSGARDRMLAQAIDAIAARLRPAAPAPAPAMFERRARPAGLPRGTLIVIALALVIAVGALAIVLTRGGAVDRRTEIRTRLAAIPCAWLQVDPVDDGGNGRLALTGVADDPARAGEVIRGLVRGDARPVTVTTDRIARIGSADCPAIDVPRALRRDDGGRLRVTSDGVGRDARNRLAEARVKLAFASGDRAMALFGIEPDGKVTWVLPDFAALDALAGEDVGFVRSAPRTYDFSLRADHLGWTGLLLVTGDAPLAGNLPQGAVRSSTEFAAFLRAATQTGDHQAEMAWYEIKPR